MDRINITSTKALSVVVGTAGSRRLMLLLAQHVARSSQLISSPCKISEPYDNPIWENSYGGRNSGGYYKDSGGYNMIQDDIIRHRRIS